MDLPEVDILFFESMHHGSIPLMERQKRNILSLELSQVCTLLVEQPIEHTIVEAIAVSLNANSFAL